MISRLGHIKKNTYYYTRCWSHGEPWLQDCRKGRGEWNFFLHSSTLGGALTAPTIGRLMQLLILCPFNYQMRGVKNSPANSTTSTLVTPSQSPLVEVQPHASRRITYRLQTATLVSCKGWENSGWENQFWQDVTIGPRLGPAALRSRRIYSISL